MADMQPDLDKLQADVFIKSKTAFYRYVGDRLRELGLEDKIKRFDARMKSYEADRNAGVNPVKKSERVKTETELWLERIEHDEELEEGVEG